MLPSGQSLKGEISGAGMYRYLAGAAVIECMNSIHDEQRFHSAVEWLIDVAAPVIFDEEVQPEWDALWEKAMTVNGVRLPPGAPIPKSARHQMAAFIIKAWRSQGVFGRKGQDTEDTKFLQDALAKRNSELTAEAEA